MWCDNDRKITRIYLQRSTDDRAYSGMTALWRCVHIPVGSRQGQTYFYLCLLDVIILVHSPHTGSPNLVNC